MDWFEITTEYDKKTNEHNYKLSSLPEVWQRELAALWRLESQVNNGAYLQFLHNCGKESYVYASQALKKIGAHRMAEIVDRCQALVEEHLDLKKCSAEEWSRLMPNVVIDLQGNQIKGPGSVLPPEIVDRIYQLSYEFIDYPDDIEALGLAYYQPFVEQDENRRTGISEG